MSEKMNVDAARKFLDRSSHMHPGSASKQAKWALRIAFVVAVPALVGGILNFVALDRARTARVEIQAAAKRADVRLCVALNKITKRDIETLVRNLHDSRRVLMLLGFPPSAVEAYVKDARARNAREIRLRPIIDCNHLPTNL